MTFSKRDVNWLALAILLATAGAMFGYLKQQQNNLLANLLALEKAGDTKAHAAMLTLLNKGKTECVRSVLRISSSPDRLVRETASWPLEEQTKGYIAESAAFASNAVREDSALPEPKCE